MSSSEVTPTATGGGCERALVRSTTRIVLDAASRGQLTHDEAVELLREMIAADD